jgi:hypothetical protein
MSLFGKESKDWTEDDKTAIMLYHNLGLSVINRAWTAKNGRLEDLTAKSTLSVFSASDLAFVAILFQYYWKDKIILVSVENSQIFSIVTFFRLRCDTSLYSILHTVWTHILTHNPKQIEICGSKVDHGGRQNGRRRRYGRQRRQLSDP